MSDQPPPPDLAAIRTRARGQLMGWAYQDIVALADEVERLRGEVVIARALVADYKRTQEVAVTAAAEADRLRTTDAQRAVELMAANHALAVCRHALQTAKELGSVAAGNIIDMALTEVGEVLGNG